MPKRLVYLDNAATTPVRPEVLEAMLPYLGREAFGNPSSAHRFGRTARAGLEEAKRTVAECLGVEPGQVIFTSGGTEADNLAIIGSALAARDRGGPFRVAVSAVEHKAVLAAAHAVQHLGGEEILVGVSASGVVEEEALDEALARGVALVSVMWVNNEVGTVQPITRLAERCRAAGVCFHSDAVQAERAPHVSNISIPGTDSEALLMHLDLAGVACSSGSACSTGAIEPSHVLTAMGVPRELGIAALRFSFGKENTVEDVDAVVGALPKIVEKVRALSAVLHR